LTITGNPADAQAITEMALQGAWSRLRQRKQDKPGPLSLLIGQLQTMKGGWDDQGSTELLPIADRATARERFSTSHIARNPFKLPEIQLDDEDFLSMIKNPPAVGEPEGRIHMDPESLDTSFEGFTKSTFKP